MATRLKVKEIAEARGMSQRKLFFRSQVDLKTIQRMFRYPTTTVVTTDTLDKLARALDIDVSLLVESDPHYRKCLRQIKPRSRRVLGKSWWFCYRLSERIVSSDTIRV